MDTHNLLYYYNTVLLEQKKDNSVKNQSILWNLYHNIIMFVNNIQYYKLKLKLNNMISIVLPKSFTAYRSFKKLNFLKIIVECFII